MTAKRKHRNTNEYLKYLKGELSPEERYSFERDLEADPFEREAMEGMEGLSASELEEDLLSLHASLRKRLQRRKRRTWYYVAATVASILIVGTVFLNIYEMDPKTRSEDLSEEGYFLEEQDVVMEDLEVKDLEAPAPVVREEVMPEVVREEAVREEAVRKEAVQEEAAPKKAAPVDVIREVTVPEVTVPEVVSVEAQPQRARRQAGAVDEPVVVTEQVAAMESEPVAAMELEKEAAMAPEAARGQAREKAMAIAPDGRISGIVISAEDMEPLPGASLMLKGSDSGLVAGLDGRFAFASEQQEPATVIASYVGMQTNEYQLAGGVENTLVMQPDPLSLNEVVVIGYDVDKSDFPTGAVQRVRLEPEESLYNGAGPEGGLDAYKMYIEEQIRFPAGDTLSKREVVILKFNVAQDGSISGIQALRSPGTSFTEEAIRLLQEGPAWTPARNESGATSDVVRMRIVFKR